MSSKCEFQKNSLTFNNTYPTNLSCIMCHLSSYVYTLDLVLD
jgi:hypothetical protein